MMSLMKKHRCITQRISQLTFNFMDMMEHHQSLMREENLYIQTLEMNMRHLSRKHKLIEWIV